MQYEEDELFPDTPTPPDNDTTDEPGEPVPVAPEPTEVIARKVAEVKAEIGQVIVGQEASIELMLAALFAGGHVLVEGVPGIAKTLTAKLLAQTLDVGSGPGPQAHEMASELLFSLDIEHTEYPRQSVQRTEGGSQYHQPTRVRAGP